MSKPITLCLCGLVWRVPKGVQGKLEGKEQWGGGVGGSRSAHELEGGSVMLNSCIGGGGEGRGAMLSSCTGGGGGGLLGCHA